MRVLVVEDDLTLAAGLVEALEREGFRVDHLGAAEPAEGAFGLTAYDLAIVDIGLPGMDGLELIRRSRAAASLMLQVGELALDVQAHRATLLGEALELTGREWNVLEQLALAVPRVVAKQKLADSLSQWDKEITPNAVEIYVSRLRAKLAGSRVGIRTVRGIGYRLEAGDAAAG